MQKHLYNLPLTCNFTDILAQKFLQEYNKSYQNIQRYIIFLRSYERFLPNRTVYSLFERLFEVRKDLYNVLALTKITICATISLRGLFYTPL